MRQTCRGRERQTALCDKLGRRPKTTTALCDKRQQQDTRKTIASSILGPTTQNKEGPPSDRRVTAGHTGPSDRRVTEHTKTTARDKQPAGPQGGHSVEQTILLVQNQAKPSLHQARQVRRVVEGPPPSFGIPDRVPSHGFEQVVGHVRRR
jgi:hypothetical protein